MNQKRPLKSNYVFSKINAYTSHSSSAEKISDEYYQNKQTKILNISYSNCRIPKMKVKSQKDQEH